MGKVVRVNINVVFVYQAGGEFKEILFGISSFKYFVCVDFYYVKDDGKFIYK